MEFKKGDYVQSIRNGYVVLVNGVRGSGFSGTVIESDFIPRKVGEYCDCWGVEYFKKNKLPKK